MKNYSSLCLSLPRFYDFFYFILSVTVASFIYVFYTKNYLIVALYLITTASLFCIGLLKNSTKIYWSAVLLFFIGYRTEYLRWNTAHFMQAVESPCTITGVIVAATKKQTHFKYTIKLNTVNKKLQSGFVYFFVPKNTSYYPLFTNLTIKNATITQPNESSYKKFLMKEGVIGQIRYNKKMTISSRKNTKPHLSLLESTRKQLSYQTKLFFLPLFLGIKPFYSFYNTIKRNFLFWGTSHYLARSGMHLQVSIFLFFLLFTFVPFSISAKRISVCIVLAYYCLYTQSSISLIRSAGMFFVLALCDSFSLMSTTRHALYITYLINLLYNPFFICALDFQLTFATTSIVLLYNQHKYKTLV